MDEKLTNHFFERTRSAFLWTRILNIPFWAIFGTLAVILYKDLHATPLQITAIVALKPIAALFSPYWSSLVNKRPDRLVSNLVWANIIKFIPFLFFPWIHNNWIFVLSFGFFMVFARGVIPAWMEIIKLNIKGTAREKTFAVGSMLDYTGSAALPIFFGWLLDDYEQSWRWVFFGTASIGILSTLFLYKIPIQGVRILPKKSDPQALWNFLITPWKESWNLVRKRPDFADFQWGFMLGGGAIMLMQTTLPMFYVDVLNLSYTEIMVAVSACKAIGYAVTTPFWVRLYDKINLFKFCSWVILSAAFFPILLLISMQNIIWVYVAYLTYGMMQSGSELSWHMSGPVFSKDEDSSLYSATNVLAVGIRGCVAPLLGTLIYTSTNSVCVMLVSCALCLIATMRIRSYSNKYFADMSLSF
jgi:hypothetical protein